MGTFESMINEMVRWNTTPEAREKTAAAEERETVLDDEDDDEDELDSEDGISAWPSSRSTNSLNQHKKGPLSRDPKTSTDVDLDLRLTLDASRDED